MPGGVELTPTDELTGLPLPVLAKSADFFIRKGENLFPRQKNFHHGFHPERSQALGYDELGVLLPAGHADRISGRALRYSRGQILPIWLHNRYHDIFLGPELPEDTRSRFTRVVLACAGVVPRQAIDLYTPGEYIKTPEMSDKVYRQIVKNIHYEGEISRPRYPNRRGELGRFIADYAINNSLNNIMSEKEIQDKIKQFLLPKTPESRKEAGRVILAHAVDASVADLIPIHKEAVKEKMAKNSKKALGEIMLQFFTPNRFIDYFNPLEDKLSIANI